MKLNNNPKKRSNFFLKISACAMLVCVMLAVFILPSSAESNVIYETETYTLYDDYTMSVSGIDHVFNWVDGGINVSVMEGVYFMGSLTDNSIMYDNAGDFFSSNGMISDVVDNYIMINSVTYPISSYNSYQYNDEVKIFQAIIEDNGALDDTSIDIYSINVVDVIDNIIRVDTENVTLYARDAFDLAYIWYNIPDVTDGRVYFFDTMTVYNVPMPEPSPVDTILGVFLGISEWLVDALVAVIPAFWTGAELTILGVLAVSALSLALILLLINFVRKFLQFRG